MLSLPKYITIKKLLKDSTLVNKAESFFNDYDIDLEEKIFLFFLGENNPPLCACGNKLYFNKNKNSYQTYCGNKCSERLKITKEKYKASCLKKYGVDNAFKHDHIREKIKQTNMNKYGVDNPSKNTEISKKIENTMINKYGVKSNLLLSEYVETIKEINLSKYGEEYPLKNKTIREKIKQTNIEKYGFASPAKSEIVKQKTKNTNLEKYGSSHITQRFMSNETLLILNDKKKFIELYNKYNNTRSLAEYLNVHPTTILNYIHKYNIDLNIYRSRYENELSSFLTEIDINHSINNRSIISPLEIDLYIENFNIGIEIHGIYWHSELIQPNTNYHLMKYQKTKEKNIFLFQFFENEIRDKKDIILSMISNKLQLNKEKIGSRKVSIEKISNTDLNNFLNKNHIQGKTPLSKIRYGAIYDNEIIGVCSFQPKKEVYELTRFCTKNNTTVMGLFSKMVNRFTNDYSPSKIISFSDNRYSNGDLYLHNGWVLETEMAPTYYYTDLQNVFHRFLFRKKNIERKFNISIEDKTEKILTEELGFTRLWDAGKKKWSLSF